MKEKKNLIKKIIAAISDDTNSFLDWHNAKMSFFF